MKKSKVATRIAMALTGWVSVVCLVGCWGIIDESAREEFEARTGPVSITVYPVHVVKGSGEVEHDAELGQSLARFLERERLADALAVDEPVHVSFEAGSNQAKMLQRSGRQFSGSVAEKTLDTDYALLVEILSNRDESWVGGVHYYLADREGRIVDARLSNSHHDVFKRVQPTDRDGGFDVVIGMLREEWTASRPKS